MLYLNKNIDSIEKSLFMLCKAKQKCVLKQNVLVHIFV